MTTLNSVSETALITLRARAVEAERSSPIIEDPLSLELLERIKSLGLSDAQRKILDWDPPSSLSSYIALRARKYDSYANEFLSAHPTGLIVSLGAGFDTRFWRIRAPSDQYLELDLPEVAGAKKNLLNDKLRYEIIGSSVLEEKWLEEIALKQTQRVLFLVEGLLMYLPEKEVIHLFQRLADSFSDSQIVFEVVHRKYTKGFRKKMVESKMKRRGGTEAGASYQYGMRDGKEVESYADAFKLIDEWSYFEDPDVRPNVLRLLKHIKAFSRTQWTIRTEIA
jgi:methyltransferase (TIGR00027 family)